MLDEIKIPEGKSPIWYCDIDFTILHSRKSNKREPPKFLAKKIVAKGTMDEMKNSNIIKISVLKEHFRGQNNVNKKIKAFDLGRVKITHIHIRRSMGFGIK